MSEAQQAPTAIDPLGVYSPRELARIQRTGPQSVYRPIRSGLLRAAVINARGDQRILGQWFLDYLSACAQRGPTTP